MESKERKHSHEYLKIRLHWLSNSSGPGHRICYKNWSDDNTKPSVSSHLQRKPQFFFRTSTQRKKKNKNTLIHFVTKWKKTKTSRKNGQEPHSWREASKTTCKMSYKHCVHKGSRTSQQQNPSSDKCWESQKPLWRRPECHWQLGYSCWGRSGRRVLVSVPFRETRSQFLVAFAPPQTTLQGKGGFAGFLCISWSRLYGGQDWGGPNPARSKSAAAHRKAVTLLCKVIGKDQLVSIDAPSVPV